MHMHMHAYIKLHDAYAYVCMYAYAYMMHTCMHCMYASCMYAYMMHICMNVCTDAYMMHLKLMTNKNLQYKKTNKQKTTNTKLFLGYLYGNMLI